MIPSKLYASTPSDEDKVIVIDINYFDTLVPYLDLKRNFKAYILVPEASRYAVNNIVALKGVEHTPPSKLAVQLYHESSWNSKGEYLSKYFNLLHVKNGDKKAKYLAQHSEEGSDGLEEELYEGQKAWEPVHNYADVINTFNRRFGISHLRVTDGNKLLLPDVNVFNDTKPRPFAYKASAVCLKDSESYILVLDTVLDPYLRKGVVASEYRPIPRIELQSYKDMGETVELDTKYIQTYELLHGVGSFKKLLDQLNMEIKTLGSIKHAMLRTDKEFTPLEDDKLLSNKEVVYSDKSNPTEILDLSWNEKQYKFTIGYYGTIPYVAKYKEERDIYTLLKKAECDPEVYRIFSHNYYDGKKITSKYVTADHIQLYIKDFYKFNDGKSFPIREIPRKVEWEPRRAPEIPPELFKTNKNPVETAIDYYLETGKGISYWNFRLVNRKNT